MTEEKRRELTMIVLSGDMDKLVAAFSLLFTFLFLFFKFGFFLFILLLKHFTYVFYWVLPSIASLTVLCFESSISSKTSLIKS